MNYGFLIRNDRCIGCHACSTACKSENDVPLGVQRTWVKSVETGVYPNVGRHFQVTRCNHCANPPCVRICPVTAMYQREDGIVEFDPDVCIGCKACLQACPYDAIYIDPESGTAAKCHYCAHRVEMDMEPACVVVCPEHAIIAGDLDNPLSEISKMLAENQVTVRKPEQGTAPKLFYVEGEEANLTPTAVERTPETFAWADVLPLHSDDGYMAQPPEIAPDLVLPILKKTNSGTPIRTPKPQGLGHNGPIMIGEGRMAEQMVQVTYNAQHKVPWHWQVPAYLVTKAIAAGMIMLLAFGYGFDLFGFNATAFVAVGFTSLLFTIITTGLLVGDLERPERFLRILLRPQWKSWLVRGAYLLVAFSLVTTVWWVLEAGAFWGIWNTAFIDRSRAALLWGGSVLAFGTAIYTAFLFGQAEGRDLWQSTLLPIHLIIQAIAAGAAGLLILGAFIDLEPALSVYVQGAFIFGLLIDLAVTLLGEFGMPHASEAAARAAHDISHGRYRKPFWWGSITLGHLLPLVLMLIGNPVVGAVAGAVALIGLYIYEYVFVMAPQEIPNS